MHTGIAMHNRIVVLKYKRCTPGMGFLRLENSNALSLGSSPVMTWKFHISHRSLCYDMNVCNVT